MQSKIVSTKGYVDALKASIDSSTGLGVPRWKYSWNETRTKTVTLTSSHPSPTVMGSTTALITPRNFNEQKTKFPELENWKGLYTVAVNTFRIIQGAGSMTGSRWMWSLGIALPSTVPAGKYNRDASTGEVTLTDEWGPRDRTILRYSQVVWSTGTEEEALEVFGLSKCKLVHSPSSDINLYDDTGAENEPKAVNSVGNLTMPVFHASDDLQMYVAVTNHNWMADGEIDIYISIRIIPIL